MTKKILFVLAFLPVMLFAQHSVKGTFSPAEQFKFAFLYRVTAQTSLFVGNADVDEKGNFEIKLDSTAVPGTYRLVYAQPQEEYNFDFIVNNKEDVVLTFDLEQGVSFIESAENKMYTSYNKSMALVNQSIRKYYGSGKKDEKGYMEIFKILERTQNEFETASKGMIANTFIKACHPYIPTQVEDVATFSKGVKNNYFKHIDFSNKSLQNSGFLIDNTINYVLGFVDRNNPDKSYIENVDTVVNAIGNNPEIKKILLEILWSQFASENNEVVANKISDKYLMSIAKASKDFELTQTLTYFKNASIGNIAPDFNLKIKDNKTNKTVSSKLSALDSSNNYLIFFWSTTCSHCLDEIPKLKEYIAKQNKEDIKVIAIALDNDEYRWKEMTFEYPDFIHVFGEGKWDNEIGNQYNVTSTPSYYILDKDKKIVSKPEDIDGFKTNFNTIKSKTKK
ncbi:TlpA disulfide reductase family protein [Lacinutrix sp. 5H-3-7-4]|uniref:TlpA family protein disulfide reductase n=1 Tax=Lacinutrix sp. (strain 5H-3-7-4) TaxID=983544 RepID=UPI00020A3306|nr:TlpA disulfide reductase family protein [Lacinutrix sp. 5H-3-7-4]AEH00639.1 Redoxin domain protein [Lacinutrix sp. 5H-3-7-4]